jgi:hypothetical protein
MRGISGLASFLYKGRLGWIRPLTNQFKKDESPISDGLHLEM